MKTAVYASVLLSILALAFPISSSCAQSISDTADTSRTYIEAEFIRNVRNINADLVKGDFARAREAGYLATIANKDRGLLGLSTELNECKAGSAAKDQALTKTTEALNQTTQKLGRARLENWFFRGLIALTIYAKIKGL